MLINDKHALFHIKLVLRLKGRKDPNLWCPKLAFNLIISQNDGLDLLEMFYNLDYLTE